MAAFAATSLASVVRFSQPWWLLLAAAGLVPPAAAAWAQRRGRHIPAAGVALQVLAVVLAAGALARPAIPLGDRSAAAYLVLRDVSDSTRTQAEAPLPWKLRRPATKSSSVVSSVEATKTLVLTNPVLVMAMPLGLTR